MRPYQSVSNLQMRDHVAIAALPVVIETVNKATTTQRLDLIKDLGMTGQFSGGDLIACYSYAIADAMIRESERTS